MDRQYKEVAGITNAVLPARSLDTMDLQLYRLYFTSV